MKATLEEFLTAAVLTAALAMIWGGILTLAFTLLAREMGV